MDDQAKKRKRYLYYFRQYLNLCTSHGQVRPTRIPYRVRKVTGQSKGPVCPICSAPVIVKEV